MTGATHMAAAAALYTEGKFKTSTLLVLAFLSHFLLDAVIHYELSMALNYLLGAITGTYLLYIAIKQRDYKILLAGFLGVLPDLNWILQISPPLMWFHGVIHFKKIYPVPLFFLLAEAAFACCCLYLLKKRVSNPMD